MRRGFKTWAERQAIAKRSDLGLRDIAPLPAKDLAQHLGILVFTPEQIPGMTRAIAHTLSQADNGWSAVTLTVTNPIVVIYNPSHSSGRQESDLMHEIAHIVCEHPPSSLGCIDGNQNVVRTYDQEQEAEADYLGGTLQLPRNALLWALGKGMDHDAIAGYFGASLAQVRYRINITGVVKQLDRRKNYRFS